MAGLVRLRTLQGLNRGLSLISKNQSLCRTISTSSKKNITELTDCQSHGPPPSKKNWVSWGYDKTDKKIDRHYIHESMFVSVTLCIVFGFYYMMYLPNTRMQDWAQREAYLELRRREELGLPPIDKDYFDPANFSLPTDEELEDTPIII
ncbi:NADH dehydrogenase [ubiquinone] 1 beta subcomplex subunit 11, mitochondrial [Belonocnema kinseyi]|uniref:NADH dehydrogenase [ubiquinone] 1 beta subcomplex subunit 11, mitochondrial n=1 Tax=Belonocnema kinseyi TaxID=2817044 RepID=UPI00143D380C|nr:NADH dehydrogenase [ubiquinone] 1 beta subcomplex subunit 11, mitochondrial [Belonocnema kinseyi]XP_033226172.1 NADH dehydrogenase [ubiquinone] 1 beta subcomplex subunit 11, mitochondrial [Belonocnema kinseyi]XP_033226173.1 NADH dehydrogenase [ubiquinone] 1 beta subcomplex subunit 11, mitochondrial [Belonocnema kinseyi]